MEVKEAIEFLEQVSKDYEHIEFWYKNDKRYAGECFGKEINCDRTITLLKSLESENKKLKKENEAYREMWRRLYEEIGNYGWELRDQDGFEIMTKIIKELEQKYLGGSK